MSKFAKLLSVAAIAGVALIFSAPAHADEWRHGDRPQWWGYQHQWPGYQHQWPGYQHGYPRSYGWPGNRFFYQQQPHFNGYWGRPNHGWYPNRWYGYQFHRDPWPRRDWRGYSWGGDNWRYH